MNLFVLLAFIVVLLIAPIRIAAKALGAHSASYTRCIVAVFLVGMINTGVERSLNATGDNSLLIGLVVLPLIDGFIYMIVFQTNYKTGFLIGLVQIILTIAFLFIAALLGIGLVDTVAPG